MSYPQFGYSYPSPASSLTSSQLLVPGTGLSTTISTTCCDSPRPIMSVSDPTTPNQSVYSSSLLSYPRVAGLPDTVYSSAYATQGYVPFGADPSAFYSPLNHDNTDAWRNLSQTTAWPYDPGMTGYPYSTGYGGLDVRRKNATRESTATLKAWLYEHIKNPYPTKGEKIMLAIITKMTLTQVSTWFANARRRLKKENKMQWSPRNRTGEDDDKVNSDDDDDDDIDRDDCHSENKSNDGKKESEFRRDEDEDIVVDGGNDADSLLAGDTTHHDALRIADESDNSLHHRDKEFDLTSSPIHLSSPTTHMGRHSPDPLLIPPLPKLQHSPISATTGGNSPCHLSLGPASSSTVDSDSPGDKLDHTSEKPRIWSLADVATSSTPPSIRRSSPSLLNHLPKHSAPVYTSSSHNFQHWMNGTSSAHTTGLSYNYPLGHPSLTGPGQVGTLPANPRANLGSNCGLPGLGVMSSPNSYTTKLSNGYLGDKNDIPQLTSGFSSTVDDTMTAFKPVAKRL